MHVKNLELCCDDVCERVENMLPSSFNTPSAAVLLSSEELNVVTPTTPRHQNDDVHTHGDTDTHRDTDTHALRSQHPQT